MTLSNSVSECQQKIANTLMEYCKDMPPALLENIVCGINIEVSRAYQLGYKELLAEMKKEKENGTKTNS